MGQLQLINFGMAKSELPYTAVKPSTGSVCQKEDAVGNFSSAVCTDSHQRPVTKGAAHLRGRRDPRVRERTNFQDPAAKQSKALSQEERLWFSFSKKIWMSVPRIIYNLVHSYFVSIKIELIFCISSINQKSVILSNWRHSTEKKGTTGSSRKITTSFPMQWQDCAEVHKL